MVIPRFVIHLSKQMQALTAHYRMKCQEESTSELREAMLSEIKTTMSASTSLQEQLSNDVQVLASKCKVLQESLDEMRDTIKHEKQHSADLARKNLSKFIIEDEVELGRVKHESQRFVKSVIKQQHTFEEEMAEPRMMSIKQIGDLFYTFLHVSQFKEQQSAFKLSFDAFTESMKA